MALSATARGTATDTNLNSSWSFNPASNFSAASSWGVLVISVDNANTNGTAHSTFTITDSLGNTWTRRISPLFDPGNANQGVEGAIFTTPQDGGTIQTSTNITITLGTNTTVECVALWEVTTSGTISYVTGGVNAGAATASPTVTTGSITSGDMVIGGLFNERGTDQTVTGDSDTSNGNWSSQQTTEAGTTTGGQTVSTQWKTVTGTATQTYNPTLGVNSDVILGYIVLHETAGGGGAVTRTSMVT